MSRFESTQTLPIKVADLLERIVESKGSSDAVRQTGPCTWEARSPLRKDSNHSMSIKYDDGGKILICDHAAPDETDEIIEELGLTWGDLFIEDSRILEGPIEDKPKERKPDFLSIAQISRYRNLITRSRIQPFAKRWDLPVEILEQFDLGFDDMRDELLVFETNRVGQVIGAVRRGDGEIDKRSVHNSCRGYVGVAEIGPRHEGRLLITEGFTDLIALSSLGFSGSIARPSAGSAKQLNQLVAALGCREVVLFADQSAEEQAAAIRIAERACEVVPVRLVIPPEGIKDLREWICHQGADREAIERAITNARVYRASKIPVYRPFPVDCLPTPVQDLCIHGARSMEVDTSMIALPALVAIAGAIGGTHEVGVKEGWTEPCILWAAVVSKSGSGKTPAQNVALKPLHLADNELRDKHDGELRAYEQSLQVYAAQLKAWQVDARKTARSGEKVMGTPPVPPPKPPHRRLLVQDITSESVGELLQDNPRGLVVDYDELTGWLGSFNAYRGGRGSDREMWLAVHGAKSIRVNRVGRREVSVRRPIISIYGGVQPGVLRRAFAGENVDNGLAARFLLAAPPNRRSPITKAVIPPEVLARYQTMIRNLHEYCMEGKPVRVPLSDDAFYHFAGWVNITSDGVEAKRVNANGGLSAALAKIKGYAARIALILHLADGDSSQKISGNTMRRALTIADWFVNETERLYGTVFSSHNVEDSTDNLVDLIEAKGGWIETRMIKSGCRHFRNVPSAQINEQIDNLIKVGRCRREKRGGRTGVALSK